MQLWRATARSWPIVHWGEGWPSPGEGLFHNADGEGVVRPPWRFAPNWRWASRKNQRAARHQWKRLVTDFKVLGHLVTFEVSSKINFRQNWCSFTFQRTISKVPRVVSIWNFDRRRVFRSILHQIDSFYFYCWNIVSVLLLFFFTEGRHHRLLYSKSFLVAAYRVYYNCNGQI